MEPLIANSPKTLRFGAVTAVMGILFAVASANMTQGGKPAQGHVRRSTEPPAMGKGKFGQDLFLAVDHRDLKAVQALLKKGADVDARNGLDFTPLYIASASHQPEVMKALLAAGAKPDAPSVYGTPLMFAAMGAHFDGAKMLLAKGANANYARVDGSTVLMMACNSGMPPLVAELVKHKADVNAVDGHGTSALGIAARAGHDQVARILIGAGAKVNVADEDGRTPLMTASEAGNEAVVKVLLEKGAKPNLRDAKGQTALLLATTYGDTPGIVQVLLASGADAKLKDARGRTAGAIAAMKGFDASAGVLGVGPEHIRLRTPLEALVAALKLVQASTKGFTASSTCISCHHEGLGRMATGEALDRGVKLDPTITRMATARVQGTLGAMQPMHVQALKSPEAMKQVPLIEINEIASTYPWFLVGMLENHEAPNAASAAMAQVLAKQQLPTGEWAFSSPRPPMQSSLVAATALSVRSLMSYGAKADAKDNATRIQHARSWLQKAPATSSDDLAFKVLGLRWAGASQEEIVKAKDLVLAAQQPDGGWSQLPGMRTDAYATGQALYALHQGGSFSVDDPRYKKGLTYLLRTQDEDGSWFVSKRALANNNFFNSGFPHGESQYSSFNATCWATMALLQTVPAKGIAAVASR